MKYRSRTDIVSQILEAANGGTSKTKIMYGAYLSSAQLKEYLKLLVDNGMLSFDEKTTEYKTTDVGRNFIKTYERVGQMFDRRLARSA